MAKPRTAKGIRFDGKQYSIYITDENGKAHVKWLGPCTFTAAEMERSRLRREIAEGKIIRKTKRVLVSDVCNAAAKYFRSHRRDTATACGRIDAISEWWGGIEAKKLTPSMIDGKFSEMVASGKWSQCTSNEYRAILAQAFRLAMLNDDAESPAILRNPALSVKRPTIRNRRDRVLSQEEETALREVCTPEQNLVLDLALNLGCRRSNLFGIDCAGRAQMAGLTWEDVNLPFRVVTFPRSKSGHGYSIPLNATAYAALVALRAGSTNSGAIFDTKSPRTWFQTALRKAQITGLTFHDLRHSFATRLRSAGVAQENREYLLGHEMSGIEHRYANEDMEILRSAVATLDQTPETATKTASPVLRFKQASGQ